MIYNKSKRKLKIAYFSLWGFSKGWWPRWDITSEYLTKLGFIFIFIGFLESKKASMFKLRYEIQELEGVYYLQFFMTQEPLMK